MKRSTSPALFLLALGIALAGVSCNSDTQPLAPTSVLLLGQETTIPIGGAAFDKGHDIGVEFVDITDSRCPACPNCRCVWEGDAVVVFRFLQEREPRESFTLHTYRNRDQEAQIQGYVIRLIQVAPYPGIDGVPKEDYRATIRVTEAQ